MTKAEIFTTAWRVAKAGQAKFGGKSSEYFAEALRMVYAVAKKMAAETVRFETAVAPVKKLLKKVDLVMRWQMLNHHQQQKKQEFTS